MFKPILEIMSIYDAKEIKYRLEEQEDAAILHVGVNGQSTHYEIAIIATSDKNDITVRVMQLARLPEAKRAAILSVINEQNNHFRFVKFVLDNDGDINLLWDCPVSAQNVGGMCWEITVRIMGIINDAFPEFMKCLWGAE